ncbi:MAG: hypothetical protein NT069_26735, partial [Planctomycetota bacterium]|nr:hypothetical protein [Planctomycetota bacterium]
THNDASAADIDQRFTPPLAPCDVQFISRRTARLEDCASPKYVDERRAHIGPHILRVRATFSEVAGYEKTPEKNSVFSGVLG